MAYNWIEEKKLNSQTVVETFIQDIIRTLGKTTSFYA